MNSTSKYYRLYIDVHVPDQWILARPLNARGEWIIPWDLQQGKPVHLEGEPFVPIAQSGISLDYNDTLVGIDVLNQRLATLWEHLGIQKEYQLIPARVEGQTERYFILNTLRIIRCVDEARCDEVTFWEPRHGDPEMVGHYRNVSGLKINPAAVGDAQIFRPWGWTGTLIVSGRIKQAMDEEGIRGARFVEV